MFDDEQRWQAVLARTPSPDFVYAVTSTGIFCRSGCSSRRPKRENVRFFPDVAAAAAAGFRPCKRCRPDHAAGGEPQLAAIHATAERIRRHVEAGEDGLPTLTALAETAALNPFHLQRTFTRLVGLSPRGYGEFLRMRRFKQELKTGDGVANATYGAGFGSSSRVYEGINSRMGMTPAVYADGGRDVAIGYALSETRFGALLVAASVKGVCAVMLGADAAALETMLAEEFPNARRERDDHGLGRYTAALVDYLDAAGPHPVLPLDLRATAFQARVWRELMQIPYGETRSYGEIAAAIGQPRAMRAVARACAGNRVALAIPCHRVIRADGSEGGYRWDAERKSALLEMERAVARSREKDTLDVA